MTHGYNVTPVIKDSFLWHRADCECDQEFPLRQERYDAALDGLDHVRTMRGAQTRRDEIEEENRKKKEERERAKALSPIRRR